MKASAGPEVDPFDLRRFVDAQNLNYVDALSELQHGKKVSHWMWYVFPQFHGLGNSPMSHRYSIKSEAEARAYLEHPVLGPRLRESAEALLKTVGRSAHDIFGSPDDAKLRSSATLFSHVSAEPVFEQILDNYFDGERDEKTLQLLGAS